METAPLPDVFTPEMLASAGSVPHSTPATWSSEGQLRHFHLGNKLLRFKREYVEEYERSQSGLSSPPSSSESNSAAATGLTPLTRARLATLRHRPTEAASSSSGESGAFAGLTPQAELMLIKSRHKR